MHQQWNGNELVNSYLPASCSVDQLVAMARNGEAAAFEELTRRHRPLLFKTALRILKNVEDAEDAVQEAYIRAFTKLASFRGESLFSTWLVRVTINTALMQRRKMNVRKVLFFGDIFENGDPSCAEFFCSHEASPDSICAKKQSLAKLHEAVEELPTRLREITRLRLQHDYSIQELAKCTGITESAVKSRLLRGRLALTKCLASR